MHQIFSIHITQETLKKRRDHRSFWILGVWRNLGQGNHMIILTPRFSKRFVFKMFSIHTKTKSRRFQFPSVWKAPFLWRIGANGRPRGRYIKLRFQIPLAKCGRSLSLAVFRLLPAAHISKLAQTARKTTCKQAVKLKTFLSGFQAVLAQIQMNVS